MRYSRKASPEQTSLDSLNPQNFYKKYRKSTLTRVHNYGFFDQEKSNIFQTSFEIKIVLNSRSFLITGNYIPIRRKNFVNNGIFTEWIKNINISSIKAFLDNSYRIYHAEKKEQEKIQTLLRNILSNKKLNSTLL